MKLKLFDHCLNAAALSVLALYMTGCASAGKSFKHQNRSMIQIGKTTSPESLLLLGKPRSIHSESNGSGNFLHHNYSYAHATPSGASARALILEFRNDTLNGKVYNSGFQEDVTSFPTDSVGKIRSGATTFQEVVRYLGNPTGNAGFPTAMGEFKNLKCENARTYCSWIHTRKSRGYDTSTIKTNVVVIAFDENGIVCDMKSTLEY